MPSLHLRWECSPTVAQRGGFESRTMVAWDMTRVSVARQTYWITHGGVEREGLHWCKSWGYRVHGRRISCPMEQAVLSPRNSDFEQRGEDIALEEWRGRGIYQLDVLYIGFGELI